MATVFGASFSKSSTTIVPFVVSIGVQLRRLDFVVVVVLVVLLVLNMLILFSLVLVQFSAFLNVARGSRFDFVVCVR